MLFDFSQASQISVWCHCRGLQKERRRKTPLYTIRSLRAHLDLRVSTPWDDLHGCGATTQQPSKAWLVLGRSAFLTATKNVDIPGQALGEERKDGGRGLSRLKRCLKNYNWLLGQRMSFPSSRTLSVSDVSLQPHSASSLTPTSVGRHRSTTHCNRPRRHINNSDFALP